MNWKQSFRSIYYDGAPEPADLDLPWAETALLVIDVQNTYLTRPDRTSLTIAEQRRAGIFTDQRVSSTVRSLADESYNVVVVEDCCAAGSDELRRKELDIINMICCNVVSSAELIAMMGLGHRAEAPMAAQ